MPHCFSGVLGALGKLICGGGKKPEISRDSVERKMRAESRDTEDGAPVD